MPVREGDKIRGIQRLPPKGNLKVII